MTDAKPEEKHSLHTYTDQDERNNHLEVYTGESEVVKLIIWHWTDFEEIELTRDQIRDLVKKLGNWLGSTQDAWSPTTSITLDSTTANETALLSEQVLSREWDTPEEDEAWRDL